MWVRTNWLQKGMNYVCTFNRMYKVLFSVDSYTENSLNWIRLIRIESLPDVTVPQYKGAVHLLAKTMKAKIMLARDIYGNIVQYMRVIGKSGMYMDLQIVAMYTTHSEKQKQTQRIGFAPIQIRKKTKNHPII